MTNDRMNRIHALLQKEGLDALALNPGPSLLYLTGLNFHLMERPVILLAAPGKKPALVLAALEAGKVNHAAVPLQAFTYNDNPATWPDAFLQAAEYIGLDGARVGVEATRLRFLELEYLRHAAPRAVFQAANLSVSELRLQKDAAEVATMRLAARIAEQAFEATLPLIRAGVTEREVASELVLQLLRAGSEGELPFQPIVAGGPNSANPHAVPGDRPLQDGDLVIIDWGATVNGYISDITRTLAVGTIDPALRRIYEVVLTANQAGGQAARPGVAAGSVDRAARAVIEQAGFGPYFIHRTGHGIGMEAHEPPYIFAENELVLAEGMAFTIEPGIYMPGRGGVRIEDNFVITANGAEELTSLPRELRAAG